ncbi:uncharacterized membrane protein YozB (DUF420 family) [Actinoalloteichus hoggarensis]|uniref:Uncharacterized protein n=1 Tax=Actinoalloteichus hoggarensis TaxID=1470176 RepID=A0A221W4M4_9PSEU|nr:DUF2306 domain-containing protein [Actinoalloteichus hoggarensis]ASO20798.1 hypothetical protein AHOG_15860 [Actinoalloteichus hoggarensis]MBB5920727.1 uncharacterized membrane protein YozB (DUF420 family) [Actinoalloteichus hoggarensis]
MTTSTGSPAMRQPDGAERPPHSASPSAPPARRTPWWRRPWIAPLAFVAVAFVGFSMPPYLTGDPDQARVPMPEGVAFYYPVLVAHVLFASVAMIAGVFQVWPWFRGRFRKAHRVIGRVYVFAGCVPAGLTGVIVAVQTPTGPVAQTSSVILSLLWIVFTVTGFRRARARRFAEHRRWMIRSFALTMSITTNRFWGAMAWFILEPRMETTFEGSRIAFDYAISGLATWLGWTVVLGLTEAWLQLGQSRERRARAGRRRASRSAA